MVDIWCDVDAALSEVPVNMLPLLDATDFKSIEADVNYNAAGLALIWHFVTTAGAYTQTAVTPTDTGGNYDWVEQGNGLFTIEIPASGGATINNDTEGFGWFTGVATGVLPWRGPVIGFRAAGLNNALIDSAYSATRGLAGTALPDAAADAAGGLPISDAGALDLDAQIKTDIDAILEDTGTTIDDLVDDLETRLTAARAGYLDNLSGGAVALEATLTAIKGAGWSTETLAAIDALIDAIKAKTDNLPASPAAVGSEMTLTAAYDAAKTAATAASIAALNNLSAAQVNAEVVDVLRTDLIPDSYAADGAQPTFAQAVLAIKQFLEERGVSGTTVTVKKPDGASTAMTFTLDDATTPTTITRSS